MAFAQLVIGPPGSGKSTYCNGMHQFLSAIGRKCSVVNLDPANEATSYPCALDIRSLIKLEDIMEEEELGPNGGVLYALEELEGGEGWEWMESGLKGLGKDYVLFDCPGQVELFTHHGSLRNIFAKIQEMGYRVCDAPPPLVSLRYHYETLLLTIRFLIRPLVVDSSPPYRFLHTHPALTLHLNYSPIPPRHAPNGSSAPERAHEN